MMIAQPVSLTEQTERAFNFFMDSAAVEYTVLRGFPYTVESNAVRDNDGAFGGGRLKLW